MNIQAATDLLNTFINADWNNQYLANDGTVQPRYWFEQVVKNLAIDKVFPCIRDHFSHVAVNFEAGKAKIEEAVALLCIDNSELAGEAIEKLKDLRDRNKRIAYISIKSLGDHKREEMAFMNFVLNHQQIKNTPGFARRDHSGSASSSISSSSSENEENEVSSSDAVNSDDDSVSYHSMEISEEGREEHVDGENVDAEVVDADHVAARSEVLLLPVGTQESTNNAPRRAHAEVRSARLAARPNPKPEVETVVVISPTPPKRNRVRFLNQDE